MLSNTDKDKNRSYNGKVLKFRFVDPGLGHVFSFWCFGCKSNHLVGVKSLDDVDTALPTLGPLIFHDSPESSVGLCKVTIEHGILFYDKQCGHVLRGKMMVMKTI